MSGKFTWRTESRDIEGRSKTNQGSSQGPFSSSLSEQIPLDNYGHYQRLLTACRGALQFEILKEIPKSSLTAVHLPLCQISDALGTREMAHTTPQGSESDPRHPPKKCHMWWHVVPWPAIVAESACFPLRERPSQQGG